MSSNSTGNPTLDYITSTAQTALVNFTPLAWIEQMSKLFCFICESKDPTIKSASAALNFAIIFFIVGIVAKVTLSVWTYYKFYVQNQYISAGASAYETKYKNLWVVITGATDGIGLEFAKKFAAEKQKLILISRSQQKLDAVKLQLEPLGAKEVETIDVDFSTISHQNIESDETFCRLKSKLELSSRQIGILVNNVGIMQPPNLLHKHSLDSLVQTVDVNYNSAVLLSWLIANEMEKKKLGAIVNVSSTIVTSNIAFAGCYRESKLALEGLSNKLNNEYPSLSIINLQPGPVNTKLNNQAPATKFSSAVTLAPDVYVNSAFNIVKAASTTPGLIRTTGHSSSEILNWLLEIVEFFGMSRKIQEFVGYVPSDATIANSDAATIASTGPAKGSNLNVAETNIDLPNT